MRLIIIKIWPRGFSEYLKIVQIIGDRAGPIIEMRRFAEESFDFKYHTTLTIRGQNRETLIYGHDIYFRKQHQKAKRRYGITSALEANVGDPGFYNFYGAYDYIGTDPSSSWPVLIVTAVP